MSLRVSFLGIVWFFAIILMFITPLYEQPDLLFQFLPLRSIVHFFMFWGFAHVWIVALKKQFKFETLRRKAFLVVLLGAILIALTAEISVYFYRNDQIIHFWNLIMDVAGVVLGGISFRLLYRACY